MSKRNGAGSPVDAIVAQAAAEREKLQASREAAAAELASIDAQLRTFDRMIRAANPDTPKAKKKAKAAATGSRVAPEKVEQLVAAMRADPEKAWASDDAAGAIGVGRPTANQVLKTLREDGIIRLLGRAPEGGPGQRPYIYKLMPDQVGERASSPA